MTIASKRIVASFGVQCADSYDEPRVLDPNDPLPSARLFVATHFTTSGYRTLHHQAGAFYGWSGTHYSEAAEAQIRADVYRFLEGAMRLDAKTNNLVPFKPTAAKVNNLIDALRAVCNLPREITAPAWLDCTPDLCPPPTEVLACKNGLLHLPTLTLYPHSPAFFNHNALDFPFKPDAPEPKRWRAFLDTLWPEDAAARDTLQEVFGYVLTSDTSQQKIFMLVGPKRSGKGTIARVLTGLLGQPNVVAPTFASLSQNFGLAPLVGKQLAVISDARLGTRTDQTAIAERLLSISGEDGLTVDRKYLPPWTGRLPTRFLLLTNELPSLKDVSGALASRFILLTVTESFYNREDHTLTPRLLEELPGILNWAIEGWRDLQETGRFQQPESAAEAIQELEDLGSPVGAFVRDRCVRGPTQSVSASDLFGEWKNWCEEHGQAQTGDTQAFGRNLRAALPKLNTARPRSGGGSIFAIR